jgi:hypothetical protein
MASHTELVQYQESLKLISNALNKACQKGVYTIDEAYLIKIAFSNLEKAVETIETSNKLESPSSKSFTK